MNICPTRLRIVPKWLPPVKKSLSHAICSLLIVYSCTDIRIHNDGRMYE